MMRGAEEQKTAGGTGIEGTTMRLLKRHEAVVLDDDHRIAGVEGCVDDSLLAW